MAEITGYQAEEAAKTLLHIKRQIEGVINMLGYSDPCTFTPVAPQKFVDEYNRGDVYGRKHEISEARHGHTKQCKTTKKNRT